MLLRRLIIASVPGLIAFIECGFVLGALGTVAANRASESELRRGRWLKFITYFLIVHLVLFLAAFGHPWFTLLMGLTVAGGAVEIAHASWKNLRNKTHLTEITLAALLFSTLSAGCMLFSWNAQPERLVFVYLIVAVLDAYSQVTGQLWGRHKIAPKISPNKTIEGALGGTIAAMLAAFTFHRLAGLPPVIAIVAGLILSCAGVAGDLSASWFKRLNKVENFSAALPGQGGILDRFNSLISAAPVFYVLTSFLS